MNNQLPIHSLRQDYEKTKSLSVGGWMTHCSVTVPPMTLAQKVGLGLQDIQMWVRRILAERNAEKAEENTCFGRMVAAKSIRELDGLIKSRAA